MKKLIIFILIFPFLSSLKAEGLDKKLFTAMEANNLKRFKLLLRKGANPNAKDKFDNSLIHLSIKHDNKDFFKVLIKKNLDLSLSNIDGNTALHLACLEFDTFYRKKLIEKGADVNEQNNTGQSPLHLAVFSGTQIKHVKGLLKAGAQIHIRDQEQNTPLHLASFVSKGHFTRVLLEHKADPNLRNKLGQTALHIASFEAYRFSNVKYLMEAKADPNIQDNKGKTALHYAVSNKDQAFNMRDRSIGYFLVQSGANPNLKDENGKTPLSLSLSMHRMKLSQFLLEFGAEKSSLENFIKEQFGESFLNKLPKSWELQLKGLKRQMKIISPNKRVVSHKEKKLEVIKKAEVKLAVSDQDLFKALKENKLNEFKSLLKNGAKPNLKDENGQRLIYLSLENKDKGFLEALIKSGADVNVKDQKGNSPLHIAATKRPFSFMKLLTENKADPNLRNELGQTALHLASLSGNKTAHAKSLLEAKADPNIQDSRGKTALHYAIKQRSTGPLDQSIEYLLIMYETNLKLRDENGKTPLMLALINHRMKLSKLLLEFGAEKSSFETFIKEHFGESFLNKLPKSLDLQFKEIKKQNIKLAQMKGVYTKAKVSFKNEDPFKAMEENSLVKFKALLERGFNINTKNKDGNSLIHLSIKNKKIKFFKALMKYKPDLNITDAKKNTPLHEASLIPQNDFTKILVEKGADLNLRNELGQTALHLASFEGDKISHVKILLKAKADLNIQDSRGKTALHYAILNKDQKFRQEDRSISHLLVQSGAHLKLVDENGKTPLMLALINHRIKLSKFLLEFGAEKSNFENFIKEHFGESFLNKLPKSLDLRFKEIKKEMKKIDQLKGAETKIKNSIRDNNLFIVLREDNLIKFKRLLKRGANPNIIDEKGNSLLHTFIQKGNKNFFKALMKYEPDLNITDDKKNTPLHLASLRADTYYVKKLIQAGADPNVLNLFGKSPLHLASSSGVQTHHIDILLKAGAHINIQDHEGKTPVHYATLNRPNEILIFLLKNKADPYIKDIYGFNPINKASRSNYFLEKLKVFYKYGLSESDKKGISFLNFKKTELEKGKEARASRLNQGLFKAMGEDNLLEFQNLLLKGANPNEKDENQLSLLHHSIEKGKKRFFNLLIGSDLDVEILDQEQSTPLHWAVLEPDTYYTQKLIEHEANPNLRNENGKTPLQLASSLKDKGLDHMRILLRAKAKIDLEDSKGKTALHYAVMSRSIYAVNALIQSGANVNAKDLKDISPLHELAELKMHQGSSEIAAILIEKGAHVNEVCLLGQTPLMKAVKSNNFLLSKKLIQQKAVIFTSDYSGKKALDYALNPKVSIELRDLIRAEIDRQDKLNQPMNPRLKETARLKVRGFRK